MKADHPFLKHLKPLISRFKEADVVDGVPGYVYAFGCQGRVRTPAEVAGAMIKRVPGAFCSLRT